MSFRLPPCRSGKPGFRKKRQAKLFADRQRRKTLRGHVRTPRLLRPYQCVYCRQWHVTSQPPLPGYMRHGPNPLEEMH